MHPGSQLVTTSTHRHPQTHSVYNSSPASPAATSIPCYYYPFNPSLVSSGTLSCRKHRPRKNNNTKKQPRSKHQPIPRSLPISLPLSFKFHPVSIQLIHPSLNFHLLLQIPLIMLFKAEMRIIRRLIIFRIIHIHSRPRPTRMMKRPPSTRRRPFRIRSTPTKPGPGPRLSELRVGADSTGIGCGVGRGMLTVVFGAFGVRGEDFV